MTSSSADLIDIDLTGIAHGGTAVGRHDGRVVFVADAIPGERVRAQVTDSSKDRFWRAETVEVLDASPHRQAHVWEEADIDRAPHDRPGGADLGHIDLAHQRTLKQQVLQEALDRFAGPGLTAPAVAEVQTPAYAEEAATPDAPGTRWRTRMTLHVDDEGNIGPYAARSHRVIPVSDFPLARTAVAQAALEIAAGGLEGVRPGERIDLVEPEDGVVRIVRRAPQPRTPRGKGRRRSAKKNGAKATDTAPSAAIEVIQERVGERRFSVDVGGFWQVHPGAATTLDHTVRRMLQGRVDPEALHFDLYGGVGLFSATLADLGATDVVSLETDARATAHAKVNLDPFDLDAVTSRVDTFLRGIEVEAPVGAVVLDPPRAGAGRDVVETLAAFSPHVIAYVACDPVALARDLGTFRALGWGVEELQAFDLFPHSHHFETVALLSREAH